MRRLLHVLLFAALVSSLSGCKTLFSGPSSTAKITTAALVAMAGQDPTKLDKEVALSLNTIEVIWYDRALELAIDHSGKEHSVLLTERFAGENALEARRSDNARSQANVDQSVQGFLNLGGMLLPILAPQAAPLLGAAARSPAPIEIEAPRTETPTEQQIENSVPPSKRGS